MDIVFINDLRVDVTIGIFDWERRIQQQISIDLELGTDIRPAAAGDDIHQALDYKQVAKRVLGFAETSEYLLVETLAEQLAALIRDEFGVPWLRLRIAKPGAVRGSREVGIVIERGEA